MQVAPSSLPSLFHYVGPCIRIPRHSTRCQCGDDRALTAPCCGAAAAAHGRSLARVLLHLPAGHRPSWGLVHRGQESKRVPLRARRTCCGASPPRALPTRQSAALQPGRPAPASRPPSVPPASPATPHTLPSHLCTVSGLQGADSCCRRAPKRVNHGRASPAIPRDQDARGAAPGRAAGRPLDARHGSQSGEGRGRFVHSSSGTPEGGELAGLGSLQWFTPLKRSALQRGNVGDPPYSPNVPNTAT